MIKWVITGGLVPMLLLFGGVFFLIYLRLQPFRSPKKMLAAMKASGKAGVSPFRALTVALAGTLGVGNIVGVANALWIGGAGAVLWMWISALVAMVLKYAEIVLAVEHRRERRHGGFFGGACYYIKDCFFEKRKFRIGVILSSCFALLMILNALSMGCMIQVNAVGNAFAGVLEIPVWISGVLLTVFTVPFIIKGTNGIASLTEWLIPLMTAGYILLSVMVLVLRHEALGAAFASIFREAFNFRSASGGVIGFLTSRALRVGTMRGLLSNEAGCGTAPTAHASAENDSSAAQGVWGILEVFVDTILLCTATALVILVSYDEVAVLGSNAVMMTVRAYSLVLGRWAEIFFCIAIFLFAYATVLCWANYGMESLNALSTRLRWRGLYLLSLVGSIWIGVFCTPSGVWFLADFAITALTTVNVIVLFLMRREIRQATKKWLRDKG